MSQPTTTPAMTTAAYATEIVYDGGDFALKVNGKIVGWARNYADGEMMLARIVRELVLADRAAEQAVA